MSGGIVFDHVSKSYGDKKVLDDLSFTINENEFFVLFGPTGVGKTTLLKLICGLEYVDSGSIFIDGEDVTVRPASERKIRMAFENFTLYPHLTVFENMAGVLRNNHFSKKEIEEKVLATAKMLEMEDYLNRLPKQLSGGQKQRVSLGRALVMQSEIYLLDEPLAHLDAKLRNELRMEFQNLKNSIGAATVVYVTHDYVEAMALGDRVCILDKTHIAQIDTPDQVYVNPATLNVARMLGQPEINVLDMKFNSDKGVLENDIFTTGPLNSRLLNCLKTYDKELVKFACRPKYWTYTLEKPQEEGYNEAEAVGFEIRNFKGITIAKLKDGKYISILSDQYTTIEPGTKLYIKTDLEHSYLFDYDTGLNLERRD